MTSENGKLVLYSSTASQWANVPLLGLIEKGFRKDDCTVKNVDLVTAENFHPEYVAVNPNGTVPSLISPSLSEPLTDSTTILEFLEKSGPSSASLIPKETAAQETMKKIIDLVHSDKVGTNLILLQARDTAELEGKKGSSWKEFLSNRQEALERYHAELPDHPFYGPKVHENGSVHKLYVTEVGPEHHQFFNTTHQMYRDFAAGMRELDTLIVGPFAVGSQVTLADLHIIPWLSHAMWGAGGTDIYDFGHLERLIQHSVPDFAIGDRIKELWMNFSQRDSFKEVFPNLH